MNSRTKNIGIVAASAIATISLVGAGIQAPKNTPVIEPLQIQEHLNPGQTSLVPITIAHWQSGDSLILIPAGNAQGGGLGWPLNSKLTINNYTTDATQFPINVILNPQGKNNKGQETAALSIHVPKGTHDGLYETGVALVLPSKITKTGAMSERVTGQIAAPVYIQVGAKQSASMIPAAPQMIQTAKGLGILPLATNSGYGVSALVQEKLSIFQGSKLLYHYATNFDLVQPRSTASKSYVNWPLQPVPGTYRVVAQVGKNTATTTYTISPTLAQEIQDQQVTAKVVSQPTAQKSHVTQYVMAVAVALFITIITLVLIGFEKRRRRNAHDEK